MKSFDYAAFKAGWRAGCKKHGIDPEAGPTSYQAANMAAEQRKARTRSTWWAEEDALTIWRDWPAALDRPPFAQEVVYRHDLWQVARHERLFIQASDLEIEAIWNVFQDGCRAVGSFPGPAVSDKVGWAEFVELWQEVRRELVDELTPLQRTALPALSDLLILS